LVSWHTLREVEEFAAEQMIARCKPPHEVVFSLAKTYPAATGLTIAFAMTNIANSLEKPPIINTKRALPEAAEIYRAVSLLAADLFELDETLNISATGTDLVTHWLHNTERFFCDSQQDT